MPPDEDETEANPMRTGYSEVLSGSRERRDDNPFALANPAVASVLFGATSPAQIAENVTALEVDAATVQRIVA